MYLRRKKNQMEGATHFPDVNAYLCAYRPSPEAQRMAAKAIFGEIDIGGKLPVSIPGCFPLGHGVQLPRVTDNKR